MSGEFSLLLSYIASYIGIIPSFVALFRFKDSNTVHRSLAILVWGGTGIGLIASAMNSFGMPNLFLLHIYTIFNFVMTGVVFRSVMPRKILYIVLLAFSVFALINSVIDEFQTMNVLNRSVSAFLIMCFVLGFFLKTLKEMKVQRLEYVPLFWISVGALFYNAGSFFIFLFSKDLSPYDELWMTYFGIHAAFTVLLYTFYTIALWVRPKN